MLVLTRKVGENVIIILEDGRRITINIDSIRGHSIRIAVDAERSIKVFREEVLTDPINNPRAG